MDSSISRPWKGSKNNNQSKSQSQDPEIEVLVKITLETRVVLAFHHGVVGARNLKENVEAKEKTKNEKEGADSEDINGYVANVNRVVPSCPDPIHNR
ncbi:hypothetical protein NC652_030695 [Populus alba x Populus x berolinensis]|uniref:Uncharacterized protein n=1 Tax=Populus alba TaxID=43335 RepID=A0ACC4B4L2_POPAL|nr:hypothetical protein NC652_030695 [Populus alba x Populus x berolinensis]